MGKLKVGFVLDDTLDTPDGVQQYVLTLGAWLSSQGHDVHYLVGATKRTDIPNIHVLSRNVKVRFNGNRMSTPLPASRRKIRKVLQTEQFDILHVQIPYSPFMANQVIRHAGPATAVIGTFHIAPNDTTVRRANSLLGRLLKSSLKRFDRIFSVSQAAADFAKQTYNIDSTILPNVVKADVFSAAQPFATYSRTANIVFLGRLVARKGCQTLLDAVARLESLDTDPDDRVYPHLKVIICGKGPLESELKAYAAAKGISDKVEFVGFVSEGDKARYLKTADIAVFPSTGGESFGIVLLEAMAAHHPIVLGADNEGYRSVLAPSSDLLFPVQDAAALAQKIHYYLTADADVFNMLEWQKMYVRQFDVSVVGPRMVARYAEALRSRGNVR